MRSSYSLAQAAVVLIWAGSALYLRFTNPDMTGTRLFLEYWQWWLLALPAFIVATWIGAVLRKR